MSQKTMPTKGRATVAGKGEFDSWVVGEWVIIKMTGADFGCKRGVKGKTAFLLRHLPTKQEHKIIPDYENAYDLSYALWYVKNLSEALGLGSVQ